MVAQGELLADGWVRRTVASEPRLTELSALYRELGMEVLVVGFAELSGAENGCTTCLGGEGDKVIFTRGGEAGR